MKLHLLIEMEYDAESTHADDPESADWFINDVLLHGGVIDEYSDLTLFSEDLGDHIGDVHVLGIVIPESLDHLLKELPEDSSDPYSDPASFFEDI